ncbi:hypothetical protein M0R45_034701 [Rubus argutus]|uniref:Uncharacterized protein n=1 Tax=Rubus argutus TaxID=59490 RepID=A0AAW1VTC4_RUBAR
MKMPKNRLKAELISCRSRGRLSSPCSTSARELLNRSVPADGSDDDDKEEQEDRDSGVVLVVRRLTRQGLDDDFACSLRSLRGKSELNFIQFQLRVE